MKGLEIPLSFSMTSQLCQLLIFIKYIHGNIIKNPYFRVLFGNFKGCQHFQNGEVSLQKKKRKHTHTKKKPKTKNTLLKKSQSSVETDNIPNTWQNIWFCCFGKRKEL